MQLQFLAPVELFFKAVERLQFLFRSAASLSISSLSLSSFSVSLLSLSLSRALFVPVSVFCVCDAVLCVSLWSWCVCGVVVEEWEGGRGEGERQIGPSGCWFPPKFPSG